MDQGNLPKAFDGNNSEIGDMICPTSPTSPTHSAWGQSGADPIPDSKLSSEIYFPDTCSH